MLLHALIPASRANGPGLRTVVFFQGCNIGCVGCWNPKSHHFRGPEVTVDVVAEEVLKSRQEHSLEGVTFSGGEPMQQADSLLGLLHSLRQQAPELSFGMFSGYAEPELDKGQYWIWAMLLPNNAGYISGKKSVHASTSPSSGVSIRLSQVICRSVQVAIKSYG
jgi:hypothetical protein